MPDTNKPKAIVFGGTGFIGSHVAEQLLLEGYTVTTPVRHGSNTRFLQTSGTTITFVDFSNNAAIEQLIGAQDVVFCCLANPRHHLPEAQLRAVEVDLTARIFRCAIKARARRFVLLSTVMVYGFSRPATAIDEQYPPAPTYAFNRVALERETTLQALAQDADIELVIVRPANTIGRRDQQMLKLYRSYRLGIYPLFGRREVRFSGIDTRDIGRAMALLGRIPVAGNGIFLAKGYDTSWQELQQVFAACTGKKALRLCLPLPLAKTAAYLCEWLLPYSCEPGLTPFAVAVMSSDTLFDTHKMTAAGFTPRYSLQDAVSDFLAGLEKT